MDLKDLLYDLCFNPKHTKWMSPLAVVADAALCALIILKVPCATESHLSQLHPLTD